MDRKILYSALAIVSMVSCSHKEITRDENHENETVLATENKGIKIVPDSTYYGYCTDGTAMHTLQFVAQANDTITLPMGMGDDPLNVYGGILIGSNLAVTPARSGDGTLYAKTVVNMSGLIGNWTDGALSINILTAGVVKSSNSSYKRWTVENGKLILSGRAFDINYLSEDSLYLVRNGDTLRFKRIISNPATRDINR